MTLRTIIRRELQGMQFKSGICFYIGIPMFVGLLLGWNKAFVGADVSRTVAISFWAGLALLEWFAAVVCSQIMYVILRPLRPSPTVIWLAGVSLAALLFFYPISRYLEFGSMLGGMTHLPAHLRAESMTQFLRMASADIFPGMALWMAANYFYAEFLGIPRHQYAVAESPIARTQTGPPTTVAETAETAQPQFMQQVAASKRGQIMALEAQDHYVKVTTDRGNDLIHYRFSDAVRDARVLAGLRVHRSHWVAAHAITELTRANHGYQLQLSNGAEVPVSRSYLRDVRATILAGNSTA